MAGCKSDDAYYAMAKYLAKFSLTLAMAPMILGKETGKLRLLIHVGCSFLHLTRYHERDEIRHKTVYQINV